jgi:hypothetical protein
MHSSTEYGINSNNAKFYTSKEFELIIIPDVSTVHSPGKSLLSKGWFEGCYPTPTFSGGSKIFKR